MFGDSPNQGVGYPLPSEFSVYWPVWKQSAGDTRIAEQLQDIYRQIDCRVASYDRICQVCGGCCRFEQYGHRLFVTGLEVAWFYLKLSGLECHEGGQSYPRGLLTDAIKTIEMGQPDKVCPLLKDERCAVHFIRPMGCRLFICHMADDIQQVDYELFLRQLQLIHERERLPYCYMEWQLSLQWMCYCSSSAFH